MKHSFTFVTSLLLLPGVLHADVASPAGKPNILLIITDQQHARMLSCAGNPYLKTPNLESLARTGARFERAYCGNPVCVPSRFSMLSGTMPSRIDMETNGEIGHPVPQEILDNTMGAVFRRAGYQTVYGGKTHVPGGGKKRPMENYGFESITADQREGLAETCATFLRRKHERPFLLVASFINPHDICYMAIRAWQKSGMVGKGAKAAPLSPPAIRCLDTALQRPAGVSEEEFFRSNCPPLPPNHGIPERELSVFAAKLGGFRGYVRQHWTERDWRLHRWAYARLTERVDGEIGKVLAALREAGLEKTTLVMFTSDHGDMDSAHRFEDKSLLYEEAVNVPLIVSWKGIIREGLVDRDHLVSTGLDLIPTMCDFAGIAVPAPLRGCSVRPLAEGKQAVPWRHHLVVENQQARLILADHWKYMVGAGEGIREMWIDLAHDPGEMKNLASDPAYYERVKTGRRLLKEWYANHGLTLSAKYVIQEASGN